MELFGSIDTTHLCFKISILMRPQSDPVSESRCFFFFNFFSLPRADAETFLLFFLAVLVVFLLLLLSELFVGP